MLVKLTNIHPKNKARKANKVLGSGHCIEETMLAFVPFKEHTTVSLTEHLSPLCLTVRLQLLDRNQAA